MFVACEQCVCTGWLCRDHFVETSLQAQEMFCSSKAESKFCVNCLSRDRGQKCLQFGQNQLQDLNTNPRNAKEFAWQHQLQTEQSIQIVQNTLIWSCFVSSHVSSCNSKNYFKHTFHFKVTSVHKMRILLFLWNSSPTNLMSTFMREYLCAVDIIPAWEHAFQVHSSLESARHYFSNIIFIFFRPCFF